MVQIGIIRLFTYDQLDSEIDDFYLIITAYMPIFSLIIFAAQQQNQFILKYFKIFTY